MVEKKNSDITALLAAAAFAGVMAGSAIASPLNSTPEYASALRASAGLHADGHGDGSDAGAGESEGHGCGAKGGCSGSDGCQGKDSPKTPAPAK